MLVGYPTDQRLPSFPSVPLSLSMLSISFNCIFVCYWGRRLKFHTCTLNKGGSWHNWICSILSKLRPWKSGVGYLISYWVGTVTTSRCRPQGKSLLIRIITEHLGNAALRLLLEHSCAWVWWCFSCGIPSEKNVSSAKANTCHPAAFIAYYVNRLHTRVAPFWTFESDSNTFCLF